MNIAVLDVPALLLAGVLASPHCAAMCGLWQARASAAGRTDWAFHGGRVLAYAGLGAIAGGVGHWLVRSAGLVTVGTELRALALVALLALMLRRRPAAACQCRVGAFPGGVAGALMGVVPCPLLYGVAGYAALSADPRQGALLLAAFALGSLPALQLSAWGWRRLQQSPQQGHWRAARWLAGSLSVAAVLTSGGVLWGCLQA